MITYLDREDRNYVPLPSFGDQHVITSTNNPKQVNIGTNTVWLMEPHRLQEYYRRIVSMTDHPAAEQIEKSMAERLRPIKRVKGKVAIMPIQGIIEQKPSLFSFFFGGFSTEAGEQTLRNLMTTSDVEAVVFDISSPGGTSYGVEELAETIFSFRGTKPMYAIANPEANSAAYWLASAADQFIATPSGDVGSIGVFTLHVDASEMFASEGIKVSVIRAGKFKADPNEFEPLSDESRDFLQEAVDEVYGKFIRGVARNRNTTVSDVRDNYGQGRVLTAEQAKTRGMIDRIDTMSGLLSKLGGTATKTRARADADLLDLDIALAEMDDGDCDT